MRFRYSKGKNGKIEEKAIVYTQDEHKIDISNVDIDVASICGRLRMEGFETYIVGGAVRDLILGKKPKDFDITSAASPSQIKKIFRNSRVIGKRFRLVHVYFGSKIIEVATFRSIKDGGTTGNTFGTIEEDVLRRDFTINALFYDPEQQIVIDYVGGLEDLRHKKIRPLISLNTIFIEDPVRMIRAVKYSVLSDFPLPFMLRQKIKEQAHLLSGVSPSRLTEEINKIINSSCVADIVLELEKLGLYEHLQPNAHKLIKKSEDFRKVYFASLEDLNKTEAASPSQSQVLSALFRDYVAGVIDWKSEPQTLYKSAFHTARQFVLPMNPQRSHIDKAIRQIFVDHGVSVRKTYSGKSELAAPASVSEEGSGKPRYVRRRKPLTSIQANTASQE